METLCLPAIILAVLAWVCTLLFVMFLSLTARIFGVTVETISISFLKPFKFTRKGTKYEFGLLAMGGYVNMRGMLDHDELKEMSFIADPNEDTTDHFRTKPLGQRLAILLSGLVSYLIPTLIGLIWMGPGGIGENFKTIINLFKTFFIERPSEVAGVHLWSLYQGHSEIALVFMLMALVGVFFIAANWLLPSSTTMGGLFLKQFRKPKTEKKEQRGFVIGGYLGMAFYLGIFIYFIVRFIQLFSFGTLVEFLCNYLLTGAVLGLIAAGVMSLFSQRIRKGEI